VEILSNCHTYYGRYNGLREPWQMMDYFKDNSVTKERAEKMTEEELKAR